MLTKAPSEARLFPQSEKCQLTFSGTAGKQSHHTFVQHLAELGIHLNIAQSIWLNYLKPFDRWMVWNASKHETDSDFLYSLKTTKRNVQKKSFQFINQLGYHGHFHLILWMSHLHYTLPEDLPRHAARSGNLELVKWLSTKKDVRFENVPNVAATRDDLAIFKIALKKIKFKLANDDDYRFVYNRGSLDIVVNTCIRYGSLKILKYVHKKKGYVFSASHIDNAAFYGHLELLEWIISISDIKPSTPIMINAVQGWNWHVLKWLHQIGCPWSDTICSEIARIGNLEILKWVRDNGCPWTSTTTLTAAKYNQLEILKWAYDNGCPISHECWDMALNGTHIPILQWMRETIPQYTKWDESCCSRAAQQSNLDLLIWLRSGDNPCPWDEQVYSMAINSCYVSIKIIEYAYQNGCPGFEKMCSWAKQYSGARDYIIGWVHSNGVPCLCSLC